MIETLARTDPDATVLIRPNKLKEGVLLRHHTLFG
jgi:hypothetical protein